MAYFTGSWITAPPLPTFSASAAFAISALAGYNSSSSLKGDLDQSSGSESDNTDEHLKIHVDNASDSAASAGFSFWVGVSIGSNAATTGTPTDSTTTNTTTSTVDGQTTITTTDADGNVTTTDVNGNPVDPVATQPELPPDPDANSSAAPKPGRQSASDLIADNPTGIQLAVTTSHSSNVDDNFSFSEKTRSSHGYTLNAHSDQKKTTSDVHFTLVLGSDETNLEFGNAKTSSTSVQTTYDNFSQTNDPDSLYHTGQWTETYSETSDFADDFQFSLNAEEPSTHTVTLTERSEYASRDYRADQHGSGTANISELYFNTTDADTAEAPIYRYVESTTGVDGTNIHTFIENTPPYPIGWVDADGSTVNPDEENPGTQPPDASDAPTTYGEDDDDSRQMDTYAERGTNGIGTGEIVRGETHFKFQFSYVVLPLSVGGFPLMPNSPTPPGTYIVTVDYWGEGISFENWEDAFGGAPAYIAVSVKPGTLSAGAPRPSAGAENLKTFLEMLTGRPLYQMVNAAREKEATFYVQEQRPWLSHWQTFIAQNNCATFAHACEQYLNGQLPNPALSPWLWQSHRIDPLTIDYPVPPK